MCLKSLENLFMGQEKAHRETKSTSEACELPQQVKALTSKPGDQSKILRPTWLESTNSGKLPSHLWRHTLKKK